LFLFFSFGGSGEKKEKKKKKKGGYVNKFRKKICFERERERAVSRL